MSIYNYEVKDLKGNLVSMKAYEGKVTSSQADYISELKIYSLTSGEYDKTLEDIKAIQSDIEKIRGLIEDPELIRQEVINEIKATLAII